jgi:hypothetical protein
MLFPLGLMTVVKRVCALTKSLSRKQKGLAFASRNQRDVRRAHAKSAL